MWEVCVLNPSQVSGAAAAWTEALCGRGPALSLPSCEMPAASHTRNKRASDARILETQVNPKDRGRKGPQRATASVIRQTHALVP